jgi:hypothetical protein
MGEIKTGRANEKQRSIWEPPIVTQVTIDAQTKSATARAGSFPEPRPPSSPATKLGFSFEMAFPMSARTEK